MQKKTILTPLCFLLILSVVLLESCSKCYKCKQYQEYSVGGAYIDSTNKFDVCESDFNSKKEFKDHIERIEQPVTFTNNTGTLSDEQITITTNCRRRLF